MKMKEQLIQRLQYLQQVAKEKEKALLKAPKGTLRVMKDQGNIRYYQRNDTNHKEVIYLTKDKISLARELAQKDYDDNYAERAVKKINCYMQNGYFPGEQEIFTYETKQTPISQRLIKELIYRYCY